MPPPTAAINDVWQLRFEGQLEGQNVLNVFHFGSLSGDTDVLTNLVAVAIACFIEQLLPGVSDKYTLNRVVARQVAPTLGPDFVTTPTGGTGGVTGVDSEPSFVSGLVSIRTNRGGRSGRGRVFLAGIPESSTTQSLLNDPGDFWTALQAWVACMLEHFTEHDPVGTNAWAFGVMSRKIGGSKPPFTSGGFAPVISMNGVRALATTRSRKVGHGG